MHYFHQFQLPFKQITYFIKCEGQGLESMINYNMSLPQLIGVHVWFERGLYVVNPAQASI